MDLVHSYIASIRFNESNEGWLIYPMVNNDIKIAIVVPTHNRPFCIKSYIETKIMKYSEIGVELIIFDSSSTPETKDIVEYYKKTNKNLMYDEYIGDLEQNAIDKKVFAACLKYSSLFDCLVFSSDRVILNFDRMYQIIIKGLNDGVDFFVYDNGEKYYVDYTDEVRLLNDWGWRMTSLSSVIFSSHFLKKAIKVFSVYSPNHYGLWLMSTIFFTIADENFKARVFCHPGLWDRNTNGIMSFWKSSGNAIWQWGYIWCKVIDSLPEKYDRIKESVILSHDEKTEIFSYNELVNFKKNGNLTLNIIQGSEQYIRRVASISIVWFYVIAIFPARFSEGIVRRIYQFLKRNGIRL